MDHFSKYKLVADDSDEEEGGEEGVKKVKTSQVCLHVMRVHDEKRRKENLSVCSFVIAH